MTSDAPFDPSELFGLRVVSETGAALGRITAAIHHRTGCDVLVERRRWLGRVTVRRLDLGDLVRIDERTCRHVNRPLHAISGADEGSVA